MSKRFCTKCGVWAYKNHKCPDSELIKINKEFKGVVRRLCAMGIYARSAWWTAYPNNINPGKITIDLYIGLGAEANVIALGGLPEGWYCFLELVDMGIYDINYYEHIMVCDMDGVKEYVIGILKEFEEFLDLRDAEAVKALLRLTSC